MLTRQKGLIGALLLALLWGVGACGDDSKASPDSGTVDGPANDVYVPPVVDTGPAPDVPTCGDAMPVEPPGCTPSWQVEGTPGTLGPYAIWGSSPSNVFVVGKGVQSDAIVRFDGTSWQRFNPGAAILSLFDVWGTSATNVYAVGFGDGKSGTGGFVLQYDGSLWTEVHQTETFPKLVGGTGPNDVWVVAETTSSNRDPLYHFDGSSWSKTDIGFDMRINDLWTTCTGLYAAGVSFGVGAVAIWDGQSWQKMSPSVGGPPVKVIAGSGPADIYVVGASTINHFDGVRWQTMVTPINVDVEAVWASGSNDVHVSGRKYSTCIGTGCPPMPTETWHFDGTSWSKLADVNFKAMTGFGPAEVFAAGNQLGHYSCAQ